MSGDILALKSRVVLAGIGMAASVRIVGAALGRDRRAQIDRAGCEQITPTNTSSLRCW